MKLHKKNDGYLLIILSKDSKTKNYRVHRLVGFAFLEKKEEETEIDHIDHNRSNNMVSNLRWTTSSGNGRNQSVSTRNTSGTQGVNYIKSRNAWLATWYEEKKKSKSFSIKEYGEQSKQMAIDYRKQMAEANGYLNV